MKDEAPSRLNSRLMDLVSKRDDLKAHAWTLHEQQIETLALLDKAFEFIGELMQTQRGMLEAYERRGAQMDELVTAEERRQQLPRCPLCGEHTDRQLNS